VCPVCSGLRQCEHIITVYVDKYVGTYIIVLFQKNVVELKMLKVKGEYLIGSVFSW
jgi:hypothetical protein